jgi:hypothetical protein
MPRSALEYLQHIIEEIDYLNEQRRRLGEMTSFAMKLSSVHSLEASKLSERPPNRFRYRSVNVTLRSNGA